MHATIQRLKVGAGYMILVGLFLAKIYGWAAGANLIEQGLATLMFAKMIS